MQQFATTQTSIAASKLPFEDVQLSSPVIRDSSSALNNNSPQRDFGNNAQSTSQNSPQKSAFDEALAKQEQSSQRASKRARAENEKAGMDAAQNKDSSTTDSASAKRAHNDANAEARENSVERSEEQKRIRQRSSGEKAEQADDVARAKAARLDNAGRESSTESSLESSYAQKDKQGLDKANGESDLKADMLTAVDENLADDFDWITYVNQVKDLSSSSGATSNNTSDLIANDLHMEDETMALDIFAQTIATMNKGAQHEGTNEHNIEIVDAQTDPEFLEISLSEKELATLINAAGGNANEQLGLHSEAMADLDKAIAKLLNQLVTKEEGTATSEASNKSADSKDDADASLLKDLLKASVIEDAADEENNAAQQNISLPPEPTVQDIKLASPLAPDLNEQLEAERALLNAEQIKTSLSATTTSPKSVTDELLLAKNTDSIEDNKITLSDVDAEQLQNINPVLEKELKPNESPLLVPVNKLSNIKQAELLAKLPPEVETSAIENIAQRVAAVVSEIKTEGKSAEFIAALQSGVKEMKEQLKQGREPGIDLKSLVSDALAASEVSVSPNAEVSLDKQLSQVTSILGAAASLNQASQQQTYLNSGLTEVQAIKEVSQQQIESTRLAQQTAVNDKGVNIFKPEGQQQLTEKVRWMVNSRNLSAEIRLDPADLGGINIKVNLSGDSASVSFVVQTQHARDALDQAAPRLREMLEEQGIELGQSSVQQDSSGSNEQAEQDSQANNSDASSNLAQQSQEQENEELLANSQNVIEQRINGGRIGGIDYYA